MSDNKPFVFPAEMPERERKLDKGVIVDVVENEIEPRKAKQPTHEHSMWEYKGKGSSN